MKLKINNKYVKWGITAFFVLAAAILFYFLINNSTDIKNGVGKIVNILMPVVVGMAIAYLLTPILNYIENRVLFPLCKKLKCKDSKKMKGIIRGIAILVTVFFFATIIYILLYMMISQIVPSIQNIIVNFDTYSVNIQQWITKVLEDNPDVGAYVIKTINKYTSEVEKWIEELLPGTIDLIKTVSMSVIGVFGVLWDFVIGFIISIYVLANKEKFAAQAKKIAFAVLEKSTANIVIKNFRFTHKTFIGFLSGKILDSLIIGVFCFVGTAIIGTPYGALVSVIIAVTNIIPFFGPFLGAIPSAFLIFIVDPMHPQNCFYFIIFVLILQQIDGNIIGPKILGSSTGLTGFWVIFAITLFGGLFGVFGMVIGVPFFAVIYAGIGSLVNAKLITKELPIDSIQYEKLESIDEEGIHDLASSDHNKSNKKKKSTFSVKRFREKIKNDEDETK